jgi:crotonobetainyl-CoA:carnitine CoA-transferase CaiB-like acyl-CoA transferase
LCDALGLGDLATDRRFDTMSARIAHYNELRPILGAVLSKMTRADVISLLGAGGIAVGPVNTVAEALEHPQILAREMVAELTHPDYGPLRYLGIPVRLSDTPGRLQTAPPLYGEHNETVLRDLGFSAGAITQLADAKVIDGTLAPVASVIQKSK